MSNEENIDNRSAEDRRTSPRRDDERQSFEMVSRITVLETKVDDHTEKLNKFFEKLDHHISEETESDIMLREVVQNLTREVAKTNENLQSINQNVSTLKMKQLQFETVWSTLVQIGGILVILASGGWAIFEYLHRTIP